MVNYRRIYIKGGKYFFTVNLLNRKSNLLVKEILLLKESFRLMQKQDPCEIDAIVVLPEHIHCIWTLPEGDSNYAKRWRKVKTHFTRGLVNKGHALKKTKAQEYKLWQRRFWEHAIQDEQDYEHHINYIHYNPVKHGLVKKVIDWPHSSFHKYVREGVLEENWGNDMDDDNMGKSYGE